MTLDKIGKAENMGFETGTREEFDRHSKLNQQEAKETMFTREKYLQERHLYNNKKNHVKRHYYNPQLFQRKQSKATEDGVDH